MSRKEIFLYTVLALVMLCLVGCGNTSLTAGSESRAAAPEPELETSVDEQLAKALADDDLAGMASLLEAGADPNAISSPGRPVLFLATLHGNAEAVRLLIDHGADVHAETVDGAILVKAAIEGHLEIVEKLLDAGADVNAMGSVGANELTSIFAATIADDEEIVELLIAHGADIDLPAIEGDTPLSIAAGSFPNFETVSLLLENGANIDHQNDSGETALHRAVYAGTLSNSFDTEIVLSLIEHGAALDIEDEQGRTPLDIAGPETEIGKMLLEAAAGE